MALGGAAWRNETRAWRRAMLKTPRPNTGLSEPIIGLMPQLHMVSLDILGELGGDRVVLASNPAGGASAKSVYPTLPVSFTKKRHSLPIFGLSALSCLCKGKGKKTVWTLVRFLVIFTLAGLNYFTPLHIF